MGSFRPNENYVVVVVVVRVNIDNVAMAASTNAARTAWSAQPFYVWGLLSLRRCNNLRGIRRERRGTILITAT